MEECIKNISSHSFLLLAHYATFAYQDLLFEYLTENKAKKVTKMNFPLPELPYLKHLEITETQNGKQVKKVKIFSLHQPVLLAYTFQSLQLIFLILFSAKKYDLIIAEDSLMAFLSILLRFFGRCKKIIFYSHGVDKQRFSFPLFNWFYQQLDTFSSTNSDFNWFLNRNFYKIREDQGIPRKRLFWIPASVPIKSLKRKENVFNHTIVFLGVVNKKNGAHVFCDIVKEIKTTIPDIRLDIIGNGDLLQTLKKQIAHYALEENIRLLGLKEFKDFSQILTEYTIGIAPYEDKFDTLTATSDSMKMRVYLAAGLPVIITKGFIFSKEIDENKVGFAVDFKAEKFAQAVSSILNNQQLAENLRKRALEYSKETDVHAIYDKTFSSIL